MPGTDCIRDDDTSTSTAFRVKLRKVQIGSMMTSVAADRVQKKLYLVVRQTCENQVLRKALYG